MMHTLVALTDGYSPPVVRSLMEPVAIERYIRL